MESGLLYTYKNNRRCLYCGTQIPDQKHASLKFCPRQILSDHSIRSCKDDYHSSRRKAVNEPFKQIADFHKQTYYKMHDLYTKTKGLVTVDLLNQWGIMLSRPIEFSMEGGLYHGYFYKYLVTQISETEYKISKHGKQF